MNKQIWIIDDDQAIRWVLEQAMSQANIPWQSFSNADELLSQLDRHIPSAILTDIRMPGKSGLELLNDIHTNHPDLPVIIMTAHTDLDSAVNSYQKGAYEYLPKPFDIDEVISVVKRAIRENNQPSVDTEKHTESPEIIGEAPAMQTVFRAIGRLAHSDISVLITGETGTGKELVAKALHRHSCRAGNEFIAINMAAIPRDLIESELFGHEKGAFTGASQQRRGHFERADNGTLFLDEIGDMPAEAQTRLLRVLADGRFYRVGGHKPVEVNVRLIAATHQNLETLVQQQQFREDLYHRLNVVHIQLPKLIERKGDIPQLTRFFLNNTALALNVENKFISKQAQHHLNNFNWPGNVRQLENICRSLTIMAPGKEIHVEDLPREIINKGNNNTMTNTTDWEHSLKAQFHELIQQKDYKTIHELPEYFEKVLLDCALEHSLGHKQNAAKLLGWGRNTLTRKLRHYYGK